MYQEKGKVDDEADGEPKKLEGAPGPLDDLLPEPKPILRVLIVLEQFVKYQEDVEDGGD